MVVFKNSSDTPRISTKIVEGLVKQLFGENIDYTHTLYQVFLRVRSKDISSMPIAEICLKDDSMKLFNPLYIEEAVRFAQAYEHTFLSNTGQFTIEISFPRY